MNKFLIQHSVYIVLSLPEIQELVDKIVQLSLYCHCPRMPLCVLCFQIFRGEETSGLFEKSGRSLHKTALLRFTEACANRVAHSVQTARVNMEWVLLGGKGVRNREAPSQLGPGQEVQSKERACTENRAVSSSCALPSPGKWKI